MKDAKARGRTEVIIIEARRRDRIVAAVYYNEVARTCHCIKDAPIPRVVQAVGCVLPLPILGGLHHQYIRV